MERGRARALLEGFVLLSLLLACSGGVNALPECGYLTRPGSIPPDFIGFDYAAQRLLVRDESDLTSFVLSLSGIPFALSTFAFVLFLILATISLFLYLLCCYT